ncbi:MAG: MFS transporter [Oscillospiraceae bacterium]|nr:MFS transporter [Oscillospiraceae bacterium]
MLKLYKENKMFRVLLTYRFFSAIGSAMFMFFILLSVHLLYENPIYTGIAGFLMVVPSMFSFAIGPIVDRRNKITIMRFTTFLEFLVLSLLAFTPLQEQLGVLFTFAIIFTFSVGVLFESPASRAFLPQIVHEKKIMEANSLISIVAMIGGIAIGAVLFTSLGGDISFSFLYGVSAIFVALSFVTSLFMKNVNKKDYEEKPTFSSYLRDLKDGAKFIRHTVLFYFLIAIVVVSLATEIAFVNRPMFLEYHAGAQGYVLYALVSLIGGVVASSLMGKLGNKFKIGKFVFVLFVLTGIARIIFTIVVPIDLILGLISMVFYAGVGTAIGIIYSSLEQKVPPNDMVGRVGTISSTFSAIAATIGALAGGFLGSIVSDVAHIFIFQGISYILIGMALILVPSVRKMPIMDGIKKVDNGDAETENEEENLTESYTEH